MDLQLSELEQLVHALAKIGWEFKSQFSWWNELIVLYGKYGLSRNTYGIGQLLLGYTEDCPLYTYVILHCCSPFRGLTTLSLVQANILPPPAESSSISSKWILQMFLIVSHNCKVWCDKRKAYFTIIKEDFTYLTIFNQRDIILTMRAKILSTSTNSLERF